MAACEVRAELKYRDGTAKELLQRCEKNLKSLLGAVRAVSVEVSALLTELVSQERAEAAGSDGDNDTEDEDDDDSDERAETKRMTAEPPSKRTKTLST